MIMVFPQKRPNRLVMWYRVGFELTLLPKDNIGFLHFKNTPQNYLLLCPAVLRGTPFENFEMRQILGGNRKVLSQEGKE